MEEKWKEEVQKNADHREIDQHKRRNISDTRRTMDSRRSSKTSPAYNQKKRKTRECIRIDQTINTLIDSYHKFLPICNHRIYPFTCNNMLERNYI